MEISVKGFIYHKDAETFVDCFDRYAINNKTHKFSVSDGVSKSFFPGIWAELLVNEFVNTPGRINLIEAGLFKNIQGKWSNKVSEIVQRPNQKYFVKNFFAQGRSAAATFVGLNFFFEDGRQRWEAIALGDSFLFFVPQKVKDLDRQFDEITYLSSKKDFEFDNFPDFFDSKHSINKGKIKQISRDLKPGTFYLMTDALSEWFIHEKSLAVAEIESWEEQKQFEERIAFLRKNSLQNDDTALLIINVRENSLDDIHYRNISITNLNQLIEPNSDSVFNDRIDQIIEKFTQTPPTTVINSDPEFSFKNNSENLKDKQKRQTERDHLANGRGSKRKKGKFWEKNISLMTRMFSGPIKPAKEDDDKDDVDDMFKDLDSITNKF